jgi:hypothetical protein
LCARYPERAVSGGVAHPGKRLEVRMLLMLEDDADRIRRFTATLQDIDPALRLVMWHNAWKMIRELDTFLPSARLISLDHDLAPEEGSEEDPGDGMVVAKFLAARPQTCPVIIHSSNVERSTWMADEFELAGWIFKTVAPVGEDWIEEHWRAVVCDLLKG